MEYQIKVSQEAERDIILAKCHYKISGQDKIFDKDLLAQIDYLKVNPYLIQIYYRDVRRIHFKNFLYSIHFIIKHESVYILRVLHQKQKFDVK